MPLISIEKISDKARLGMWQMESSPEELLENNDCLKAYAQDVANYKSTTRKMEYLAERALLHALFPTDTPKITHNEDGKPLLTNQHAISISHTRGFVVIMTAPEGRLGVDIEYRSDRVNKIADKFIRKDEHADTTEERLAIWSAKETTYKYFSEQNLEYYDMKTEPFTATEKGFLEMRNLKSGGSICVNFVITSRYLLTFASEEMKK